MVEPQLVYLYLNTPPPPRRGEHGVLDQKLASCRFLPDPKFPSLGILGFRYQAQDPCQTRRGFNPSLPPRGNPPRTVWSAEREEHEQVISKIPKIRRANGPWRVRSRVKHPCFDACDPGSSIPGVVMYSSSREKGAAWGALSRKRPRRSRISDAPQRRRAPESQK